ncbi:MAG TPA: cytochrome c [Pyrinomonadaceae bacterium]|jgi:hypothetical protein
MRVKHSKTVVGTSISLILLFTAVVVAIPLQGGEVQPSDSAAYYKAKCAICHGQKAEKKFDATMTEDQMVEAVLKGKKAEKPPNMPGFESKGVNADQAKALVVFMKQLKESAPAQ